MTEKIETANQVLTEEEITGLKELQSKYQAYINILGNISVQEIELKSRKDRIENELFLLKEQEQKLTKEIEEKYGIGSVSLDTGEFVPFEDK